MNIRPITNVKVKPQIAPFNFGEERINEMDMVSAYCTVNKGDLPIDITWTKNGRQVYTNNGVVVTHTSQRISVVSIEAVQSKHSGTYSCIATNSAGSNTFSTLLEVNGYFRKIYLLC